MIRHFALLIALAVGGCGGSGSVDVMFECASPGGEYVATVYRVATGERPNQRQMRLNVRPQSLSFDADMYSFAFRYGDDVILHWPDAWHLQITYPKHAQILRQERVLFGTSQTYSSTDSLMMDYRERPSTHGYFMVEARCNLPVGG